MAAEFKREKIVSERRRTDETKSLRLHSVQESVELPHTCDAYSIRGLIRPLYMNSNCAGERNWGRRYRNPNFEEADLVREEM